MELWQPQQRLWWIQLRSIALNLSTAWCEGDRDGKSWEKVPIAFPRHPSILDGVCRNAPALRAWGQLGEPALFGVGQHALLFSVFPA